MFQTFKAAMVFNTLQCPRGGVWESDIFDTEVGVSEAFIFVDGMTDIYLESTKFTM